MSACDRSQLVVEHAGEREQVVALVLQRDAYWADATRIGKLPPTELYGDEIENFITNFQVRTGQGQNIVGEPGDERSDVAGKRMRCCFGL